MDEQTPVSEPGDGVARNGTAIDKPLPEGEENRGIQRSAARRQQRAEQLNPRASDFFFTVFWLLCCGAFVVGLWHIGPLVAERYQYAATRGRAIAEYENATRILKDDPLAALSAASELVAQKIRPSVVSIECERLVAGPRGGIAWAGGQGSGVIVDANGLILTNAHVVEGARNVVVTLYDSRKLKGEIAGFHDDSDLAVLKVNAAGLVPCTWGDSEMLKVGSMVWAVGSPYGLDQTVTQGIVSGKNRFDPSTELDAMQRRRRARVQELIQTDAAVNKGNSGGPLVDAQGNVVGINTSIIGEQFQGISFAIPSSVARYVSGQLVTSGSVQLGYLGIRPRQVRDEMAEALGLPDLRGALVDFVEPGTPAARAGLQRGDVIRQWNGVTIEDFKMLFRLVATTLPGSEAKISILRQGQPVELTILVEGKPST